ncbi:LuxR C-terminal-related transcriptional regulator [Pseudonocardia sp. ICBG1293]|uniref:helix-turn-helix transcriptional regulator n=1 Tax=Pseudonocardia sp. ICBG1293 TaxID=2844382 RepID=UPI001CCBA891|nr:LuxR C-terminal-related transcriptional regulator [Pseudonocardia sp. ICBG1293]
MASESGSRPGLLRTLVALDAVDVAFAAAVDPGTGMFVLDRFEGARTDHLRDVRSLHGHGLGGRCIALRRPVFVRDYVEARGITHQFDRQVAAEGLRAILAVPVVDGAGRVEQVVYSAARRSSAFGQRLIDRAVDLVGRSRSGRDVDPGRASLDPGDLHELVTALSSIAREIADPGLRRRLQDVVARTLSPPEEAPVPPVRLSRRELDVLTEVARGLGNRRIGERLGLTEHTVKSYLKSAMYKLDSSTRGEAVFRARGEGLLP